MLPNTTPVSIAVESRVQEGLRQVRAENSKQIRRLKREIAADHRSISNSRLFEQSKKRIRELEPELKGECPGIWDYIRQFYQVIALRAADHVPAKRWQRIIAEAEASVLRDVADHKERIAQRKATGAAR